MKFLPGDEYPAVNVICHNSYMIIDVNRDPNLKSYFSEWYMWHYALAGKKIQYYVTYKIVIKIRSFLLQKYPFTFL
jgi:hypothetical protein